MKEKKNQSPDEKPGAQEGAAKNPLKGLPRNVGRALTGATQNVGRTVGQNLRRRRRGKEAQPQIIENETETDTVPDNDTDENGLLLDHEDEEDPSSVKEENRTLPAESSLVVFGRWADILLDDSSIFLLLALFLALLLTVTQFERVQQNQIPLSVASSWVFLAYAAGQAVSIRQRPAPSQEEPTVGVAVEVVAATARSPELPASASTATATPIDSLRTRQTSHRLLNALLGPTRSSRILFKRSPSVFKVSSAWTHLNLPLDSARKTSWHRKCDPTRDSSNNDLMKILLRNRKFPRVRRSSGLKEASSPTAKESFSGVLEEEPSTAAPAAVQSSEMGSFELPDADSLDDFVVNPLLKLRGMDIFLTDGDPESSVADHPWLIENGLRDVPTFITNIISQWGNILIYFEMPAWVTDWKTIQEEKEDTDEVKALKVYAHLIFLEVV